MSTLPQQSADDIIPQHLRHIKGSVTGKNHDKKLAAAIKKEVVATRKILDSQFISEIKEKAKERP